MYNERARYIPATVCAVVPSFRGIYYSKIRGTSRESVTGAATPVLRPWETRAARINETIIDTLDRPRGSTRQIFTRGSEARKVRRSRGKPARRERRAVVRQLWRCEG